MNRKLRHKMQKQTREEIGMKACIREHNRLLKMNDCYNAIRDQLHISPTTSKAKTLVEAIRYIKMLEHVLEAPQEGTELDDEANNGAQAIEPQLDDLETAENLMDKYTLKDDFRTILPPEKQDMSISVLAKQVPYFMKLLSLTTKQAIGEADTGLGSVQEFCFSTSCKRMPLEVDEQTADTEDVTEQMPPIDTTEETDGRQDSSFMANSLKFLIKNILDLSSDDESAQENQLDCPLISDEEQDTQSAPSPTPEPLQAQSLQTGDPSFSVQDEPEQADTEQSLIAALEANLGEASFEWLELNLPEQDEFFNEHYELIELDLGSDEFSLDELLG